MPAFNAGMTLEKTYLDLPMAGISEVILVDDASSDDTVEVAMRLGLTVIRHEVNQGYGANQKTCYTAALDAGADIIVMVHPDFQYDSRIVPVLADIIELGICDVVLGNRMRSRAETLAGGMPVWKYLLNRTSTFFENFVLGETLGDFHSGFRAYSRKALEIIPYQLNSDDFAFDQELLIEASHLGLRIGDVPVPVRYFPEASSINFARSLRYGFDTLRTLGRLLLHNVGVLKDSRFVVQG
jgi:glycosyltransferase involved in cell wall biosynthesis